MELLAAEFPGMIHQFFPDVDSPDSGYDEDSNSREACETFPIKPDPDQITMCGANDQKRLIYQLQETYPMQSKPPDHQIIYANDDKESLGRLSDETASAAKSISHDHDYRKEGDGTRVANESISSFINMFAESLNDSSAYLIGEEFESTGCVG